MKKINAVLLGILFALFVQGQESKFSIGLEGSPDIYYYRFINDRFESANHKYEVRINYTGRINMQYKIGKNFSIITGLQYCTKNFNIRYNWNFFGFQDPTLPMKTKLSVSYLGVPLMLSCYVAESEKASYFVSGGFITDHLQKRRETSIMANDKETTSNFLETLFNYRTKSTLISGELGLGIKYKCSEKVFATLTSGIRYGFGAARLDAVISNPASFGLLCGIYCNVN